MLGLLGALSTPLAAQAIAAGFAATVGGGWQIEAGELALVRRRGGGPIRALSAGLRVGSFVDERAIFGGTRGFVGALSLGARTGRVTLAELGDEQQVTVIGLDVTVEASGYLASNSPLAQGPRWTAVSFLPGLRVGDADGTQYGLVIGPTVFFGATTDVRALLAFRVETPLARRERHP